MCLDCGCMRPDDDHGDQRHITAQRLAEAADANGTDVSQVRQHMDETLRRMQQGELQTSVPGFSR